MAYPSNLLSAIDIWLIFSCVRIIDAICFLLILFCVIILICFNCVFRDFEHLSIYCFSLLSEVMEYVCKIFIPRNYHNWFD